MRTKLILSLFDKNGKAIEQREQEARSWLKHFIDLLYLQSIYNVTLAANDISGASRTLEAVSAKAVGNLQAGSAPGQVWTGLSNADAMPRPATSVDGQNVGIVVGTNPGAVTPTQDALLAKVVHGEAAGQLLYSGCELYGLTFVNPNGQFTIRRYFTNVLGGAITIQEVGIYCVGVVTDFAIYSFCIARDVVAPGITVNNGEILEVTYTPQITV